jgi:O-acetyl-ADP-ribose deacetylase (regulator of RNase III)
VSQNTSLEIEVRKGSLLEVEADAIVNPANSHGLMGGGVAGVIKRAAGSEVEKEAISQAPIPVGKAATSSGGKTKFQAILHAPTMTNPAERIPVKNVSLATRAALTLADQKKYHTIAIPGMGTGVGAVEPAAAAQAMLNEIRSFKPSSLKKIILIDVNDEMISAWRKALSS